ncbi:MAG: O-antigen ligase family protein [Nitrospira sp.]|nr:O-antigen ligase family protein [Nitrospira sp.]
MWFLVKRPDSLKFAFASPFWPLTLFVLVAASSIITVSRAPMYSLWRSVETSGVLLWGVLVFAEMRVCRNLGKLFMSFYAMSALMLLGVVVAVIIDPQHAWMQEGSKVERLDVTSTFLMGANTIGVIAAFLGLVALSRFMMLVEFRYLMMCSAFLVLCYAARSRTGFVVFVLGVCVLTSVLLRMPSRRVVASIVAVLSGVCVIGLLLVSPEFTDAVSSTFTRGHSEANIMSLDGRMSIWAEALQAFEQSPLLGSGYATYPMHITAGSHFHNMFVELAVTTGLLGLVPIFLLFALLGTRLIRLFLNAPVSAGGYSIESLDALLIGTVVFVSEITTAGAAYYSWQMIGLVVLTVSLYSTLDVPKTDDGVDFDHRENGLVQTIVDSQVDLLVSEPCKQRIIY